MASNSKFKRLNASREYIADSYRDPFSLTSIAKNAYMSPFHFSRSFKKVYGETPNEFLIKLRIEKAKKMLITENMSISEICERVGYISVGSFSSLFLRQVGMPPTLYRRTLWALSSEAFRFPSQVIPSCYAYHFLGKSVN